MLTKNILDEDLRLCSIATNASTATSTVTNDSISFVAENYADFKVIFPVKTLDLTTTNETYVLSVEASTDDSSFTEVGTVTATATGLWEVPLSGQKVEQLVTGAAYMRTKATLGGTTPIIAYDAYITLN